MHSRPNPFSNLCFSPQPVKSVPSFGKVSWIHLGREGKGQLLLLLARCSALGRLAAMQQFGHSFALHPKSQCSCPACSLLSWHHEAALRGSCLCGQPRTHWRLIQLFSTTGCDSILGHLLPFSNLFSVCHRPFPELPAAPQPFTTFLSPFQTLFHITQHVVTPLRKHCPTTLSCCHIPTSTLLAPSQPEPAGTGRDQRGWRAGTRATDRWAMARALLVAAQSYNLNSHKAWLFLLRREPMPFST